MRTFEGMGARVAATGLVALAGLSGCSLEETRKDFGDASVSANLRPESSLDFRDCGEDLECAEVEVPLDRNDPDGPKLSIAINRVKADSGLEYGGVLLVNPGGPGGSGLEYVAAVGTQMRAVLPGFDIIGFDPRGVGQSSALDCASNDNVVERYLAEGISGLYSLLGEQSEACEAATGDVRHHLGSNEVVEDIDHIREALGNEQINFLGISYGTRLGALYAQQFPTRIRALVLDAPLAPVADLQAQATEQFDARLAAHEAFFGSCADGTLVCGSAPRESFEEALEEATADGQGELFALGWAELLTTPVGRAFVADLFVGAEADGMEAVMDGMDAMPPEAATAGISPALNYSVNCADNTREPLTEAEADTLMSSYAERSETFGILGLGALTCAGWDVDPDPVPVINYSSQVPALIFGGLEDSVTPVEWAFEMQEAIEGSVLVLSEHYGHSALAWGGVCPARSLREYLRFLRLPEDQTVCPGPAATP